jgi:hypothetical protein
MNDAPQKFNQSRSWQFHLPGKALAVSLREVR